jgi:tetratricopeptide (TPR) repeat protein
MDDRRWTNWRPVLLVVAALAAYANSLSAPFIFDDELAIVSNAAIRSPENVLSQERNTPLAGRPVVGLTFALNFAAAELDPRVYRATNIAIHIACALLLFAIVRRTLTLPRLHTRFGRAAPDLAFAAALLWVLHPLTTDAVTYITQRTESLMGFFYLLTFYASLRAYRSSAESLWQAAAIVACALGMGTKESMATAPVMVPLFDRIFLFTAMRDALRARWRLYAGLALTWSIVAYLISEGPRANSVGFSASAGPWAYLLNQSVMISRYIRLAIWPSDLVINYGPPVAYSLGDVLPYMTFIVALLLVTIAMFRWNAVAGFLGSWFFITLAPSSSFIPITTEVGAERRMYLPLMAITVAVVSAFYVFSRARRVPAKVVAAVLILVAVSLGAATISRNREHQSWLTLAETTLERWPTDVAHGGVGSALATIRRDQEALPHLQIAARTDPRSRYNLGITLYNLQRYDEAIRELDVLVRRFPMREEVPWSRRLMGYAHKQMSRIPEAINELRLVLTMTPNDSDARRILVDCYNLYGIQLAEAGKYAEAIVQFRLGLDLDTNNGTLRYNLATALFDNGEIRESLVEARKALSVNPQNGDAYNLIGKALAMQGQFKDAVAHLEAAVKLKPDDPAMRDDLQRVQTFLNR